MFPYFIPLIVNMKPNPTFSFIFTLLFTGLLYTHLPSAAAFLSPTGTASSTTTTAPNTEFIYKSCQHTLYPDVCYATLSGYASAVQQDPGRLARVAIAVSLSKARRVTTYVNNNLSPLADNGDDHRVTAVLNDCSSTLGDSVDQMQDSLMQMKRLGGSADEQGFQLNNVLTWMSAAETNEDTCVDGFDDVESGPVRSGVYNGVVKVKELTSNALALVNALANKVAIP
ncbi:unnamed protein product [Cuscuta europaea]|uniref:Pectinesterase inhibitor domain-containing protein n=1 Tax=Cuscuta europaea TaxID=41803 RepID=A0A9P0ZVZ9_CUSEU|nr:unnamed protein product [Cuscuta europaea]